MMLALAAMVPALLAATGRRQAARHWLAVVGGTLGLVLALKLLGHVVALGGDTPWPRSPSGHVAAGCLIWGGTALAAGLGRGRALALGLVVALAVGVARFTGGQHSLAEIGIGAALALAGLFLLARRMPPPAPAWHRRRFLAAVAIISLLTTPLRFEPEPLIGQAADAVHQWLNAP